MTVLAMVVALKKREWKLAEGRGGGWDAVPVVRVRAWRRGMELAGGRGGDGAKAGARVWGGGGVAVARVQRERPRQRVKTTRILR